MIFEKKSNHTFLDHYEDEFLTWFIKCLIQAAEQPHRQIAQKFVWPSMAEDIKECVRTCLAYQQSKIHRHNHTSPTKIPVSLEHVHIDIVGPLLPFKSFRYLLTMIDRFTRWPEAITGLYWKHIGKDIFHSLSSQIWSSTPDHN